MQVKVNDRIIDVPENTTIADILLKEHNFTPEKKGIAVAINDTVIPKNKWTTTVLKPNDDVIIIIAAQGG